MNYKFAKINVQPTVYVFLAVILGLTSDRLVTFIFKATGVVISGGYNLLVIVGLIFIVGALLAIGIKVTAHMQIENQTLFFKKFGLRIFAINIPSIVAIDRTQGHHILSLAWASRNHPRKRVGFYIKTNNGFYEVNHELANYEGFLAELQMLNPSIQLEELAEKKNSDLQAMQLNEYVAKYKSHNSILSFFTGLNVVVAATLVFVVIIGGVFLLYYLLNLVL